MAVQGPQQCVTLEAAADQSGKQFYILAMSANKTAAVCSGVTDKPIGVQQDKPVASAGAAISVCYQGYTKILAGGTVAAGDKIGTDGNGKAVAYVAGTDTTKYLIGICVVGGASGELIEAIIDCPGAGRGA